MQAIVIERLEGPSAAVLRDVPEPQHPHHRADGHRVVVEVAAVGLSVIDVLQSRGAYQYGTPTPYVLGSEIAGTVVEADPGSGFAVGDRVGSIVFWGGLAERAVVAPDYTARIPDDMSFAEGAGVYLNYSTAWFAYHRSGVRPGGTVLVHGAAGGVGTALLDLAPAFGARAIAVVSSEAKAEVARAAGAWQVVRSDGAWKDEVLALTDGHGVDAVLDTVGGDRFTDSLRALRTGGMLVVIGFAGGSIPEVKVNRLLLRNLSVTGISMDTFDAEYPGTLRMVRDAIEVLMASGGIHPHVGEVFPFERAADAMRLIESRAAIGKVVVER
ncbi:NADPH:quinone oxidoreductase family protein [Curtobacterium sp. Leaf261]|uniref:NADPH:quinone oxidoreductase family protein n=1 Tax=Curtobacterium sp. Leaf261 TaxID=1736311 RepID=UPI0006F2C0BA|nr:NADPH:quinone oxidoreductase family protein [Curtobacterium sp. Leaf261]KQO62431.1 NADPH-quinone reductase [Curtobacterium sp. Leaf261]